MRKILIAWSLATLSLPASALADSDGYYCVGRGYLAYETRFSENPGQHLLHIVQWSRARGMVRLPPIPLEEFQVHAMRCQPTAVELDGWTVGYSVSLSDPGRPGVTTYSTTRDSSRGGTANLGRLAREGVVDLESDGSPGEFQLVIARVSRAVKGGLEHYILTRLIHRYPQSGDEGIVASLKIFEGMFFEPIH